MNHQSIQQICTHFNLGNALSVPHRVHGGLLHRTWRVKTSLGTFAIKELNAEIMRRPGVRASYQISEEIANKFAQAGIPAAIARKSQNSFLYDVEDTTVLVFDWIEGKTLPSTITDARYAHQIGAILARMHALNLQVPQLHKNMVEPIATETWSILENEMDSDEDWQQAVLQALPALYHWIEAYNQAIDVLQSMQVVSHRDLDQKNVLWDDDDRPFLVDWEAAGFINPTFEMVNAALDWSGLQSGFIDPRMVSLFVQSYKDAGGTMSISSQDALLGSIGNWLEWLHYNVRRATGELAATDEERLPGKEETLKTLHRLHLIAENRETIVRWIDAKS